MTMAPARSPHRAEVPPVAPAGAEDAGIAAADVVGAAEGGEVVGVAGIAGVVAAALPPGDALAAVKENLPLTGCPSAEVARHVTVYPPAGDPGCSLWAIVLPTSAALPV